MSCLEGSTCGIFTADYFYDGENCALDNVTQLTDPEAHQRWDDLDPHWSPDGQYIVFSGIKMYMDGGLPTWLATIFKMSATGGEDAYLQDLSQFTPQEIHAGTNEFYPRYKPDGERIVFWRYADDGWMSSYAVVTMDDDGGSEVVVHDGSTDYPPILAPTYSPDGNYISFIGVDYDCPLYNSYPEIFAIPENGGPLDQLTDCDDPPAGWQVWDIAVRRLPLGGSLQTQSNPEKFKLYVPTRWGGRLEVTCEACTQAMISDPHGDVVYGDHDVGLDVELGNSGFFTIYASGPVGSTLSNTFTQKGWADKRPWNFYWWSAKNDTINGGADQWADTAKCNVPPGETCDVDTQMVPKGKPVVPTDANPNGDVIQSGSNGILETVPEGDDQTVYMPNLFDEIEEIRDEYGRLLMLTDGALKKYDDIFHPTQSPSREWEIDAWRSLHHDDYIFSNGHCWGAASASIMVDQPSPDNAFGQHTLTEDQLEGLWAELGHGKRDMAPLGFVGAPCVKPVMGADDSDRYAPRLHDILERVLMDPTDRRALFTNLRDPKDPGTGLCPDPGHCSNWNHAVYRFEARLREMTTPPPELDDTHPVIATTTVWANKDVDPPRGLIYSPNCPQPPCLDCFEPDFGVCLYSSRVVTYQYQIAYGENGYVNTGGTPYDDFLNASGQACFVPQSFFEIERLYLVPSRALSAVVR
jgi:hypothetical protein